MLFEILLFEVLTVHRPENRRICTSNFEEKHSFSLIWALIERFSIIEFVTNEKPFD